MFACTLKRWKYRKGTGVKLVIIGLIGSEEPFPLIVSRLSIMIASWPFG